MNVGILGGGVSGLSLAYFLKHEHNINSYEVLEKNQSCGGLCTTFEKNGFFYDLGGHIIFSTNKDILDFEINLLGENVEQRRRNNKIWYKKRYVKYPFENDLSALDKEETFECLRDYIKNDHPKPTNLKEWLYYTFGTSIADKYMLPYNKKVWKTDPALMGLEWVERIPKPPVEDVIKSAIGIETEGYKHQLNFFYPKSGGFQSLIRAFESKVNNIYTDSEIISIQKENKKWKVLTTTSVHNYDTLVSTISVFKLLKILKEPIPKNVQEAINNLEYNSMIVVLIGLNKIKHTNLTSLYVPDEESLAHRYCFSNAFSENLSPKGCSSIIAEMTVSPKNTFKPEDSVVIEKTIWWLEKEGFISKQDICERDIKHIKYAYPIYDINYKYNIQTIYKYFNDIGIHLLGRFAEFKYINSDVCILTARNLAKRISTGL